MHQDAQKAIITVMFFFAHNDRSSRCALNPHKTNELTTVFSQHVYYIDKFSI